MESLKLSTSFAANTKDVVIVNIEGYVDQANCSQLESLFKDLKEDGCYKLIFDFTDLVYLSSAGWGVFIGEIKDFRERGGDIKIVNMNPQVYEVFQMLEFYHIINDYSSIGEALKTFNIDSYQETIQDSNKISDNNIEKRNKDFSTELTQRKIDSSIELDINLNEKNILGSFKFEVSEKSLKNENDKYNVMDFGVDGRGMIIDVAKLPIHEKIRKVVSQYPLLSIFQIKKMLTHEEFGKERMNILKLYKLLKRLDLETKEKRYRYWRSC